MGSVDVIVPCYRYGHFLSECVSSVLAQEGPSVRVLIIDDASPDNTSEIAAELSHHDPRVTVLSHARNRGHIATYNEGIEWASAEYFLLLSADDYLLPGSLQRACALMDQHHEVGFTFGAALELHEDGSTRVPEAVENLRRKKHESSILNSDEFVLLSGVHNIVPTPTAVIRTHTQKRLGGYRHELPHSGDMEMWLRLASDALVGILPDFQAVYRRHSNNMSLGYNRMSDLQQRKAAFDLFFQTRSHALADTEGTRRKIYWLLSCDAVSASSAEFNEGNLQASEELATFAVETCENIRRSIPWLKLTCKRTLGRRVSNAVRRLVRQSL